MRALRGGMRVLVLGLCGCAAQGGSLSVGAALRPPPGFTAEVQRDKQSVRACQEPPPPYTDKLIFPSKYQGSGPARDELNPQAYAKYKDQTTGINTMEKEVSAMVSDYMHSGNEQTLECALTWLDRWASAAALEDPTSDHSGKSVRKWALASLASSWLRLKFSASHPLDSARDAPTGRVGRIDRWLGSLARLTVNDWSGQPLVKINNHEYWAAWAVMATGVALNRRDYFDWAVAMYKTAAKQVDEDGYLPNELARDTRALMYHNYALEPLAMIAAFAKANGVDLTGEGDGAIPRLAERVLEGVDDPARFEQKTGRKQVVNELREASKFAWLEPYCWTYGCDSSIADRVAKLRPMKTYRLGGDVTELFAKRSAS